MLLPLRVGLASHGSWRRPLVEAGAVPQQPAAVRPLRGAHSHVALSRRDFDSRVHVRQQNCCLIETGSDFHSSREHVDCVTDAFPQASSSVELAPRCEMMAGH